MAQMDLLSIAERLAEELGLTSDGTVGLDDLAQAIYSLLEYRVGDTIASGLDEAQLSRFESLIGAQGDATASDWLDRNSPDHDLIVLAELRRIETELREHFQFIAPWPSSK